MAKTKISEFSTTAADNTDITNINIAEGCSPANLNNAVRSLMALLKDSTAGASGQVLLSAGGSTTPTWGSAFVTGMIILWSGSSATIPTGWLLCDGSSSTPDLRNRFVVGATSTYAVGATGGSADAIVVSHTHTVTDSGHTHTTGTTGTAYVFDGPGGGARTYSTGNGGSVTGTATTGITVNSTGSSGTNANLPPYYALCYIMKA